MSFQVLYFFPKIFVRLFIWLLRVLVVACRHVGSSSLGRERTGPPALRAGSLSHWPTREVPRAFIFDWVVFLLLSCKSSFCVVDASSLSDGLQKFSLILCVVLPFSCWYPLKHISFKFWWSPLYLNFLCCFCSQRHIWDLSYFMWTLYLKQFNSYSGSRREALLLMRSLRCRDVCWRGRVTAGEQGGAGIQTHPFVSSVCSLSTILYSFL